jgi:cold-inducible RNA-binding protein
MAKTLYVGNLSFQTEEEGLRAAFSEFGNVTDTRIVMDRDTGRSRGFGFVEMEDDQAAESAIERMNGADLDGRPLRVNEAQPRNEGGRSGGGGGGRGGNGGGRGGYGGGRGGQRDGGHGDFGAY